MFKHIFVPYDGSNYSKHAFQVALEIATKFGSKITLVTCLFRSPEDESFYISEHVKNTDSLKNNAMIDLGRMQEIAKVNKIATEVHVISCNSAVEALTTFANSNKVDLIVMGTRGNTGFKPLLLGSVSIGVSQHATCPILLVK
ncbi:MAG: universal stress protein [Thaumarchaeota archaeon]|nr:universal stress protein [Nitrososphaerota archaeon]MDE1840697.1 universal stress protein [Nitrososphaerota archaeon]MDE1878453.1 universal stress protein [Nitrososphaerota archaeon]